MIMEIKVNMMEEKSDEFKKDKNKKNLYKKKYTDSFYLAVSERKVCEKTKTHGISVYFFLIRFYVPESGSVLVNNFRLVPSLQNELQEIDPCCQFFVCLFCFFSILR